MNNDIMKELFWLCLSIMKSILSLAEFKLGKNSDDYKYFKSEVMNYTFNGLTKFYQDLLKQGYVKKCPNNCKIRQGFSKCFCGGCGYVYIKK